MKLPAWLKSTIKIRINNRWKKFFKYRNGYYIIWIGTQLTKGDDYERYMNVYSLDITFINIGLVITYIGNPPKTYPSMGAIESVMKKAGL